MKLLWSFLRTYKRTLALAMALAIVNTVFSLIDPIIFRFMLDDYITKASQFAVGDFVKGVGLLVLLSMGVVFVSRVAKNFQDYYVNVVTERVGADLYSTSVAHAFSLPYAVFEDQRSGELLQKLQKARADSQKLIAVAVNVLLLALVSMLFVMAYGFYVHWLVGLTYVLMVPILGYVGFTFSKKIKSAQKAVVAQTAELAGSTTETLRNVELVKSLGLEDQEIHRLNDVNAKILGLELQKVKLIRYFSFGQGTLINALRSALQLLMFWLIARGELTIGEFFSLLFYSFAIFQPLGEMANVFTAYQETRASMDQLGHVLKTPSAQKPSHPKPLATLAEIAFHDLTFQYPSADTPSVEKISLEIRGGETVAFVGPSGSGKSTLVKLMVGLYPPSSGSLTVNGIDSLQVDHEALRRRIGLVTQDTQLFAGTIRENLLFVRPDATDEECEAVLRQAAAMPIIERGDKGLDTKIGEGGIRLSGGEKQRLAIARALLRNPELLIFDEATSALDSITERQITGTIEDITRSHPALMSVLVAHRLSTVMRADRIYVLELGSIVEVGSHDELLSAGGLYAALWREQQARGERLAVPAGA